MIRIMVKGQRHSEVAPSVVVCLLCFVPSLLQQCLADVVGESYIYELDDYSKTGRSPGLTRIHERPRRQSPTQSISITNQTITDNHNYYISHCFQSPAEGRAFWVDLDDPSISADVEVPDTLLTTARKGKNIHLKFEFPFYGHPIKSLVITTGGFIYTGTYLHRYLAATQYIAPLMGNFYPSPSPTAGVRLYDNGTALTVEWTEQNLSDNIQAGKFTFQATLFDDGRIVFAYKQIPIPVSSISEEGHPVKVGLADAYYIDEPIAPFTKKREIYEYHRVQLDVSQIGNGTAILIIPLPTCNTQTSCTACLSSNANFNCTWCEKVGRCSSGFDRHRQTWTNSQCEADENSIDEITECPGYTTPRPTVAPTDGKGGGQSATTKAAATGSGQKQPQATTVDYCKGIKCQNGGECEAGFCNCPPKFDGSRCQKYVTGHCENIVCENGGKCVEGITKHICDCHPGFSGKYCDVVDVPVNSQSSGNPGLTVGAIVCIILITILVVGLFIWAVYAYRHPTSPSGLFILEAKHRIKGRSRGSNGIKYKYHQQMDSNHVDIQL